jgi:histidyl-tRNA synthetase
MALSTQPYKGARDFYPEDKRKQKYIFAKLRAVVERYGYEEYDAPILEPLEIYLAKTGEEIVNEQTYVFEDRGGRKVVIRPEMTPTVSRMVAGKRQELAYPLRWYSIPNLWRYERPQRGRLREHWQLNVDLFGEATSDAELEMLFLIDDIFKSFGAKEDMYEIRLNSRILVNFMLKDYLGLNDVESHVISKLIDRMNKMERTEFITKADAAVSPEHRASGTIEKLLTVLDSKTIKDLPVELSDHETATEISSILKSLQKNGVTNARFDIGLMRGFDYYTDIVFEVFDTHPDNNRSMLGGGRYDGLVGLFGVEPVATVGFGWGDVTLANFLDLHNLMPELKSETNLYAVVVSKVVPGSHVVIQQLRKAGIKVATDLSGRKIGDQIKAASKKSIEHVIIIGGNEIEAKKFNIKNLDTGEEETLDIEQIITKFSKA